jgi:hypothetical protein
VNYAIAAYVATALIWIIYFVWLGRRIRRARED